MKTRRHHNNKGLRQIKRGKTSHQVEIIAGSLGLGFRVGEKIKVIKRGEKPQWFTVASVNK